MKTNEHAHLLRIIIGIALCMVSVVPLMACSMLAGENDLAIAMGGSVMLLMIGAGLYLLVHTCVMWRGFKKLLR